MKVELEQVLHMVSGLGETSYATNSRIQENAISKAKPIVEESVSDVYCTLLPQSLAIADLGCSSGPTALTVISNVMAAISEAYARLSRRSPPEVLFFLNDLPGNDFNTIFMSLARHEKEIQEKRGNKALPYYVAGAPGCFYGRLFPRESIHFVHSSYSVHWLSQVPQGLLDNYVAGVPMNPGNIYIARTSPSCVCEAYLQQFRRDFSTFLKQRAEEFVVGGQMVSTFLGRSSLDPLRGEMTRLLEPLTEALNSIVSEGRLGGEKVDGFDMPFYAPVTEEVRTVVVNQGSFDLCRVQVFELNWDPYDDFDGEFVSENKMRGQNVARCVQAMLEPMLASHFGESIIDDLFSRYAENVAKHFLEGKTKHVNFTIALKKRS